MRCETRLSGGLALCLVSSGCSLLFNAGQDAAGVADARTMPLDAALGDGRASDATSADDASSPCGTNAPIGNCTGQLVSFEELSEGTVLQEHQGMNFTGAWRVVSTEDGTCGITFHVPDDNRSMRFVMGGDPTIRRLLELGVENTSADYYTARMSTGQAGGTRELGLAAGQYQDWNNLGDYDVDHITFTISTGSRSNEFVIHYLCYEAPP